MISGRQIREARMMLGWRSETLCERVNIDDGVLTRVESVVSMPSIASHQPGLVQQAFERAGIRFGRNGAVLMTAARQS